MAAFVAGVNAGGDTTTVTSGAIDTTGANLIVVHVVSYSAGSATLSDSKGNTWTKLTDRLAGGGIRGTLFYVFNPTVGSGHTFTGGNSYPVVSVAAFSGADAAPFDVENGATGSGATLQPGSVTPSTANNIVVCGVSDGSTTGTPAIDSGFTEPNAEADGAAFSGTIGYLIQTAATAQNPTWSGLTAGGYGVAATIAVFKATAAGGATGPLVGAGHLMRGGILRGRLVGK